MLADTIFFRETESFWILLARLGPSCKVQQCLSDQEQPSFLFKKQPSWEHSEFHPQRLPEGACTSALQLSLVNRKDAIYSTTGILSHGQRRLRRGETLFVVLTLLGPPSLPLFAQSFSSFFCGVSSSQKVQRFSASTLCSLLLGGTMNKSCHCY